MISNCSLSISFSISISCIPKKSKAKNIPEIEKVKIHEEVKEGIPKITTKNSSNLIYEDEQINDSDTDNCLKYSYPEFFFSLNLLKNIEKLIFKKSDDPGNKVSVFFLFALFRNTFEFIKIGLSYKISKKQRILCYDVPS